MQIGPYLATGGVNIEFVVAAAAAEFGAVEILPPDNQILLLSFTHFYGTVTVRGRLLDAQATLLENNLATLTPQAKWGDFTQTDAIIRVGTSTADHTVATGGDWATVQSSQADSYYPLPSGCPLVVEPGRMLYLENATVNNALEGVVGLLVTGKG